MDSLGKEEMAYIRKHGKKWQSVVRRNNLTVIKSFWKKSDASKWAYKTEAQIETGSYKRVQEAEKLSNIKVKEILSTYYEKYLRIKSKDANKEKYLIDLLSNKPIGNKYITELTGSALARFRDHELEEGNFPLLLRNT